MLHAFLDSLFQALRGGLEEAFLRAEIILHDEMFRKIVSVLVAAAVPEPLGSGIMRVAQMLRHGKGATGANVRQCRVDGGDDGIALAGGCDVERRFSNGDARFGPSDEFRRLNRRRRQHQRHRIGQPNVFRSVNHDAARDETRVFAGVNHLGQPVERRVGIAASHRFDECGNGVIMPVLIRVIHNRFALDAFFRLHREHRLTVDNVERIIVTLPEDGARVVNDRSMPDVNCQYVIAVALLDGSLSFDTSHSYERMRDPQVLAVKQRVRLVGDRTLMDPTAPRSAPRVPSTCARRRCASPPPRRSRRGAGR